MVFDQKLFCCGLWWQTFGAFQIRWKRGSVLLAKKSVWWAACCSWKEWRRNSEHLVPNCPFSKIQQTRVLVSSVFLLHWLLAHPSAREWVANVQFSSGDHPITTQTKLNWPNDVLPKLPLATTHKGHVWRTGIQNKWYLSRSLPAYAPSKYIQWVLGNFMLSNFCFAFVSRIYHISLK